MPVTLKDVAEAAGVSRSAVSRTFTEGASVSEKTRRKVLSAADRLGYRPNALASALTTGRTRMIGLVSNNFDNPFFLQVFERFTRALQDAGLRPLLVNLAGETDEESALDMLRQYSVDGVIVASSTLPPEFTRTFRLGEVPVVHAFGCHSEDVASVHLVGIDNVEAGRIAARALLARGYERIGFMGGPQGAAPTRDRRLGFREVLSEAPQVSITESFAEEYAYDAGRALMARLIEAGPAQAYFCGDDVLSIGALSAVQEAGLRVPEDIGLIGLNDMQIAGWQNIALTTIRQPVDQIVNASVALIEAVLDDPSHAPQARLFPCALVERRTLPRI